MSDAYTVDVYSQLISLIHSSEDRIPICFCIDVSGSMNIITNRPNEYTVTNSKVYDDDGVDQVYVDMNINPRTGELYEAHHRIDELKRVLYEILDKMCTIPSIRDSAIIYIVTFSEFAQTEIGPKKCNEISKAMINSKIQVDANYTASSRGINLSLEKIDFMIGAIEEANLSSYPPVLIFMSDGAPTDGCEAKDAGKELYKRSQNNELKVIPIAIGDDLNLNWMRSLTNDSKVYTMKYDNEFDEVFEVIRKRIVNTTVVMPMDAGFVDIKHSDDGTEAEEDKNVSSSEYGIKPSQKEEFDFFTAGIQS